MTVDTMDRLLLDGDAYAVPCILPCYRGSTGPKLDASFGSPDPKYFA